MIYVSHPYGGLKKNKRSVERTVKILSQFYEDTFISPIHAVGFMYRQVSYEKGMKYCLDLLNACEQMIVCPGWTASKGCMIEYDFCRSRNINVITLDEFIQMKEERK